MENSRKISVERLAPDKEADWNAFLLASEAADYCHDVAWRDVIQDTYGKKPIYLMARDAEGGGILGVAPAFFLKSLLFGRQLVAMPYLDFGGLLAHDAAAESALLEHLKREAENLNARLEVRCRTPLRILGAPLNEKVGMALSLKDKTEEGYWKSLDAKVRNQVRKAEKSQVTTRWGKSELLEDFYHVFCINMRDLGSPVHSRHVFRNVLKYFPGAEIGTAYREGLCIGGLLRLHWKDSLAIPWASTLKDERVHCPNNALYWESIQKAFQLGCRLLDFGRSTRGEGTYKFKCQWKADETPLCWYPFDAAGKLSEKVSHLASGSTGKAAQIWSRLPLPLTRLAGPGLRAMISA